MTAALTKSPSAWAHARAERSGRKGVGNVLAHAALTLLLVVTVALAAAVAIVPRVTGSVPLTVLTGSMTPTYRPGDVIVVRPTPTDELAVGDVVTFQPVSGDPTLVTHRIIELRHDAAGAVDTVITQGDANGAPDDPLVPEQIQGRVWYRVPFVGRVTLHANPLWVGAGVGLALVAYAVVTLAKPDKDDRRRSGKETP